MCAAGDALVKHAAFARLVAAVATTRHEAGLTDDEGVLPDAFLCWSLVHGCSSLLANGQAKRHAPTPDDELRLVRALLERNHALFAPPRPRA